MEHLNFLNGDIQQNFLTLQLVIKNRLQWFLMFLNIKHIEIYIYIPKAYNKMLTLDYGMNGIHRLLTWTLKRTSSQYDQIRVVYGEKSFTLYFSHMFRYFKHIEMDECGVSKILIAQYCMHSICYSYTGTHKIIHTDTK